MPTATKVVRVSHNQKTGSVGGTYRPVGPSCPPSCALLKPDPETGKSPCYATKRFVNMHQKASAKNNHKYEALAGLDLVRHCISGGHMKGGTGKLDHEHVDEMLQFHKDYPRTQGWSYTHDYTQFRDNGHGPHNFPSNLSILASVDSIKDKENANADGWNTARVIGKPEDATSDEVLCPYDKAKFDGVKARLTCRTCKLCWKSKNIAFVKF